MVQEGTSALIWRIGKWLSGGIWGGTVATSKSELAIMFVGLDTGRGSSLAGRDMGDWIRPLVSGAAKVKWA